MARHSHWAQIKLKKGAADVKRGKIFTRHARLIEMCARKSGGDEKMNPALATTIENARADNMPRENIDRAIKKGTGQLKDAAQYEDVMYEAFGPGGVAFVIETLTDNKNRTFQSVRTIITKAGGNMGSAGATSFLFERKGELSVKVKGSKDDDELEIIDAGAQDIAEIDGGYMVYTQPNEVAQVRKALLVKGFVVESPKLNYIATTPLEVNDKAVVEKIFDIIELLEADDDVTNVAAGFEVAEGVL